MTQVTNTLVDEENQPVVNAYVEIRLVAYLNANNEKTTPAFTGNAQVISRVITKSLPDGTWTLDLIPNSNIVPENSFYIVTQRVPGTGDQVATFVVPNDDTIHPLRDLLTAEPPDLPVSASLITFDPEDSGMESTNVEDAILEAYTQGIGGGGNAFGWYSEATIDDNFVVIVTFETHFGIDDDGFPYYDDDPDAIPVNEMAVLLEDLTLMQPGR